MADDLISRQAAKDMVRQLTKYAWSSPDRRAYRTTLGYDDVQYGLVTLPAAEAVEVVRCKDCVRCGFCGEATNLEVMGFYGYCSRGKRREENAE